MSKYGNDILLFDGDLAISPRGDLFTTIDYERTTNPPFEGYYNMIFSIFNRLNTVRGELIMHEEYGSELPILVSQPNNDVTLNTVRAVFEEIINEDPRVEEVNLVEVTQKENKISVTANLKLNGKAENTVFIFPNFYIE
jgi:phage baseplate assembly protein W